MVIGVVEDWEQTILRDKAVIQAHLYMLLYHSLDKSWWNKLEQLGKNKKNKDFFVCFIT